MLNVATVQWRIRGGGGATYNVSHVFPNHCNILNIYLMLLNYGNGPQRNYSHFDHIKPVPVLHITESK